MEYNNNEYMNYGKEVVKLINKNGAEAYFVGEFARNILLNKPFSFIEIFTTASNSKLEEIFSNYPIEVIDDENVYLNYMSYPFSLCTFRSIVKKNIVKVANRHYNTALMDYLERRDFVINAIAINSSDKVIDVFDAKKDIRKKKITMIGIPKVRFNESPVRILRAMALVSEYGFKLDKKIYKGIKKRKKLLKKLSPALVMVELKPIIEGKYAKRAIRIMGETGIYKKLPVLKGELKRLAIKYKPVTYDEFMINAFVKNGEINQGVLKCAEDEKFVKDVVNIALTNLKSDFDIFTLYRYGLDKCLAANKANVLVKKQKKKYRQIEDEYRKLVIKKTCDLEFKGQDILKITKDNGGQYLIDLIEEIEAQVLLGELDNEYEAIRVYVYKRLYEMKNTSNLHIKIDEDQEDIKDEDVQDDSFDDVESSETEETQDQEEYNEERYAEIDDNSSFDDPLNSNMYYQNEVKTYGNNKYEDSIKKIELDELELQLNKEIENMIQRSQVLDGLTGTDAAETYNRMKAKYRNALIEKYDKYKRLKDRYHE